MCSRLDSEIQFKLNCSRTGHKQTKEKTVPILNQPLFRHDVRCDQDKQFLNVTFRGTLRHVERIRLMTVARTFLKNTTFV